MPIRLLLLLALSMFITCGCGDTAPHPLTAGERRAAIAALAAQVEAHYIDPAAARRIGALLRARAQAGSYDALRDEAALAQRLSADLLQASQDARLRVLPLARPLPWWRRLRDQAGVASIEKIGADIGYIAIDSFVTPDRSARRYAQAFGQLADTNMLILDLRHNAGGDAGALQLLVSYVIDRPDHYADLARRDATVARWAFPQLATRPYLEKLTILVGPQTSAEAENFAFAMQAWKRGTVVGSRSAGVTTASGSYPVARHLVAAIPDAHVTLPPSRASWQGGIRPDVATTGDALKDAKRSILRERLARATTPMGRAALRALLNDL